jgi:hypothetical protein
LKPFGVPKKGAMFFVTSAPKLEGAVKGAYVSGMFGERGFDGG